MSTARTSLRRLCRNFLCPSTGNLPLLVSPALPYMLAEKVWSFSDFFGDPGVIWELLSAGSWLLSFLEGVCLLLFVLLSSVTPG